MIRQTFGDKRFQNSDICQINEYKNTKADIFIEKLA